MVEKRGVFAENLLKNGGLLLLSFLLLVPDTLILVGALLYSHFYGKNYQKAAASPQRENYVSKDSDSSLAAKRKTVLVTSTRMAKSLTICRALRVAGARVIGAEIPRMALITPGRFSRALSAHYRLPDPLKDGLEAYTAALLLIIETEAVDLWIPVSDVHSTIEDCMAADTIRQRVPTCKVLQLETEVSRILDDSHKFLSLVQEIWGMLPETHAFTDTKHLESHLASMTTAEKSGRTFFLKSVVDDPVSRAAMTVVPRPTGAETTDLLFSLNISEKSPWLVQEFIRGKEYCTHSVVVHNQVRAFVACPSSDLVMHYEALPADDELSKTLLKFTRDAVGALSRKCSNVDINGQICFDFIVREKPDGDTTSPHGEVYPLECNPRMHTAVVLFSDNYAEVAKAYLGILDETDGQSDNAPGLDIVYPNHKSRGKYWLGHDLVINLMLPIIDLCFMRKSLKEVSNKLYAFWDHLIYWKDPTFEVWDPLPWWCLYHLYLPALFIDCIWNSKPWSRMNISTIRVRKEW